MYASIDKPVAVVYANFYSFLRVVAAVTSDVFFVALVLGLLAGVGG